MIRVNNFDQAKNSMGYRTAAKREGCQNCAHVEQRQPSGASNDLSAWRCTKGGFGTSVHALCGQYAPAEGQR